MQRYKPIFLGWHPNLFKLQLKQCLYRTVIYLKGVAEVMLYPDICIIICLLPLGKSARVIRTPVDIYSSKQFIFLSLTGVAVRTMSSLWQVAMPKLFFIHYFFVLFFFFVLWWRNHTPRTVKSKDVTGFPSKPLFVFVGDDKIYFIICRDFFLLYPSAVRHINNRNASNYADMGNPLTNTLKRGDFLKPF